MAGATYQVGEQKIRPGVYIRVENVGEPQEAIVPQGIVAVLFRASWGPLGEVVTLESAEAAISTFGSQGTVDAVIEAFKGGCKNAIAYRLGNGGEKATLSLQDENSANAVTIIAKHIGTRGNDFSVTIRDTLADDNSRELLLYEGTMLRQTITFAKGGDEAQALVDAVKNSNSQYIDAKKENTTSGTLATVVQQKLTGGEDPIIDGESYGTGLSAIEAIDWNVLCVDTDVPVIHAVIQTYIDRVVNEGKRVIVVLGEPTSVDLNTRFTNASAFNDPAIVYVANGFKGSDGVIREGYKAAARVAGMIASANITDSLTRAVVRGATEIVGALTNPELDRAVKAGALVFVLNSKKQVCIDYGINTFIIPTAEMDAGWSKIRRVRTRYNLIDRITATWDGLVGKVDNDPDGRATLIAAAQGIINKMASPAENAILGGVFTLDSDLPPAGDSAWFVAKIDDKDSAEKMYIRFGFRFGTDGGPIFGEV